jgi:hypothetical protein
MTVPLRNSPGAGSAHAQPTPLPSLYVQVPAEQVRDLDPQSMGEGPMAPLVHLRSGVLATSDTAVAWPGQDGVVGGQDVAGLANSVLALRGGGAPQVRRPRFRCQMPRRKNSYQLEAPLRNRVRQPSGYLEIKDRRDASSWRSDSTVRGVN